MTTGYVVAFLAGFVAGPVLLLLLVRWAAAQRRGGLRESNEIDERVTAVLRRDGRIKERIG